MRECVRVCARGKIERRKNNNNDNFFIMRRSRCGSETETEGGGKREGECVRERERGNYGNNYFKKRDNDGNYVIMT